MAISWQDDEAPPPITEADFPLGVSNLKPPKRKANGEHPPSNKPNLLEQSFWIKDAQIQTNLPYVIKGIFGKNQIAVFWGAPGSGKTFISMEMACHVGAGKMWRGRRTRKGIVLYVAAESARSYIENRFSALKTEHPELAESDVLVVPLALDLLHADKGDVLRVIETAKLITEGEGELVLIVIDTLAVTFGGGNENSPDDMGQYVANIINIREATNACVLVVHHAGKDEAKGMRGHSALLGALDAELAIEGKAGDDRILRTGKVRDGDGYVDLFAFGLRRVELGTDADGDPVSTCVVDARDEQGTKKARQGKRGLGSNQKAVLRILEAAGGKMLRAELTSKLKEDGMSKNRAYEAVAGLIESKVLCVENSTFSVFIP